MGQSHEQEISQRGVFATPPEVEIEVLCTIAVSTLGSKVIAAAVSLLIGVFGVLEQALFLCAPFLSKMENVYLFVTLIPAL